MQNAEVTIPKLDRIVATGVRLTLDNFGEGYSSLSHIQLLPIHGLKIARPFIKTLADPNGDSRLVRGIIELANSPELRLVAEGIEEPEQRDALRVLGCPLGRASCSRAHSNCRPSASCSANGKCRRSPPRWRARLRTRSP